MNLTYYPGFSPLHSMDARAKILLLLIYSFGIFFLGNSEVGQALLAIAAVAPFLAAAVAKIPWREFLVPLVPVFVMALITFVALGFPTFEPALIQKGFCAAGRMIGLAAASMVVAYTTTSSDLLKAFRSFLSPLGKLGVPVNSLAFTLSLALRFIPMVALEYSRVSVAIQMRCASDLPQAAPQKYSVQIRRLLAPFRAATTAFVAVFIGLFRRADAIAQAMDARCFEARRDHSSR